MIDTIELTRDLIAFDTTNPPGREATCAAFLASLLEASEFDVRRHEFGSDRMNLVASWPGEDPDLLPLVLTGHLDTVPLGRAPWSADPFAGDIKDGLIYGRGASDMKAGVAAMVASAVHCREKMKQVRRGVTLVFTSGEETGCAGALELVADSAHALAAASAMIVGEPTGNRISTGHKGCLAVKVTAKGTTAHSSMPHKGNNAIYRAARAVGQVEGYGFQEDPDPLLGLPTINVGMMSGGMNYNSVPDTAEFTIDVRTIPAMNHAGVEAGLKGMLGNDLVVERFVDMPAIRTAASDPFAEFAFATSARVLGPEADQAPLGIPFFSDASVLTPSLGCPTLILGPGEPELAHQTDEYCRIDRLLAAVDLYEALIVGWCG